MAQNRFYFPEYYKPLTGYCIFISHQKRDSAAAKKIADYIIQAGIDVYFDEYDSKIDRTDPFSVVNAIKTGIKNSTHMLCLLSQNALDSKWIPWEVGYGYDRTEVVGLTLKEISKSDLPEYLQIVTIVRGTKSLNTFISKVLNTDEYRLMNEEKLVENYKSQHPLDSVLDWQV